jgi:hypothetical protein
MLEREREAETISASWPSSVSDEEPAAAELAQDLQNFIGQYQSLSHDSRPVSPGDSRAVSPAPAAPELAPSSVQEEVSTMLVGSPVPTPDRVDTGGAPAPTNAAVSGAISRVISDPDGAATRFEPLAAIRRALQRAPLRSAESGTNLTVSSSLPSGAGTALGSGGGGLTAPSAALLVVAIACLLATRLLGRPAMRSLAWRSALLSLRLERPG